MWLSMYLPGTAGDPDVRRRVVYPAEQQNYLAREKKENNYLDASCVVDYRSVKLIKNSMEILALQCIYSDMITIQ